MSRFRKEPEDPWGQDRRPPSLDELLFVRDMTPGGWDRPGGPLQPRESAEEEAGEA